MYSDPRHYIRNNWVSWGLWGVGAIDTRARLLDVEGALDSAYDPYAFLRNVYLQHRDFKVNGGQSSGEEDQEQKMLEESGEEQGTKAARHPHSQLLHRRRNPRHRTEALHAALEQLIDFTDAGKRHEVLRQVWVTQRAARALGGAQPVQQYRKTCAVGQAHGATIDLERPGGRSPRTARPRALADARLQRSAGRAPCTVPPPRAQERPAGVCGRTRDLLAAGLLADAPGLLARLETLDDRVDPLCLDLFAKVRAVAVDVADAVDYHVPRLPALRASCAGSS